MPDVRSKTRNARMLFLPESAYGVLQFPTAPTALTAVLAQAANPGATSLVFDTDPNAEGVVAGDVIAVGRSDNDDLEYYLVDSGYVSGTTVTLDASTPVIFKREIGYAASRVTDTTGFKRIPGFIGTTLVPDIGLAEDEELKGRGGISGVRGDLVRASGDINMQVGITSSEDFLQYAMNAVYYQDADKVSPAQDDTLNGAVTAGGTQIIVSAVPAGWSAGDTYLIIDKGTKSAEIVLTDSGWDGIATTIPLDASTPLLFNHATSAAVEEVATPFTKIFDRGQSVPSFSVLLHFTDSDAIALYRGVKISAFNMTVNPNNGIMNLSLSVIAKSVQLQDSYIFSAPTTLAHTPFTNWENEIRQDGTVLTRITEHNITIDHQLETDGFEEGSRFIGSADEDKGRTEGSFTYKYHNNARVKDLYFENERALRFITSYKAQGAAGEAFEITVPKVRFGGSGFPQVPASGFINNVNSFMGLDDEGATDTDVQFKFTNGNVRI